MSDSGGIRCPGAMNRSGDTVDVSVLVVTLRAAPDLVACVEAIHASIDEAGVVGEVILVANGLRATRALAALGVRGVSVVPARVNRGFAGGLRLARSRATGTHLAVVQDDAVLEPAWIRQLREAFDQDPALGAASGTAKTPAGEVSREGWVVDRRRVWGIDWSVLPPVLAERSPRRVEAISSSSVMVRADAWDDVDGPDARLFPLSHVDMDLCLRLLTGGWSVGVVPDVSAVHAHGTSLGGYRRRYANWRNGRWWNRQWAAQLGTLPSVCPAHRGPTPEELAELVEAGAMRAAETPHRYAAIPVAGSGRRLPDDGWRGDVVALMRVARFRAGAEVYRLGLGAKNLLRPSLGPVARRVRQVRGRTGPR